MKKNKVVIVSNMYPSLNDPAYGSFVKEQSEELEKNGVIIKKIVSFDRAEGNRKRALMKYISIWCRTLFSAFNPKNKIYHFHYVFPTALIVPILKKFFRKKIVLTFHGSDLLKGGLKKDKLMSFLLPSSDKIILVSDYLQKEFNLKFPSQSFKTHSINCGVNDLLFFPQDKELIKKKLGLPADKFNILYLGRLIKDKGIDVFEKIVEELKDNDNLHFTIVGDGDYKNKIHQKFKDLSNVTFYDSIPKNEVPDWFNSADVFIFPTKREAFGLVALESIACGTPVITHQIGGVPEIIQNKENGFLVSFNDYKEFSEKILEIYNTPSIKNSLSIKGYEKSKENTIEKQIEKILDLYKTL
ncbi:glycosyltransferase family 4 protein [Bacillus mexicanus]|uniref:glycosyltransferase family 4 protein n=1 Tax=Bacillus mexicanus TaxID=2834415 RepID=UPI003D25A9E0